MEPGSVEESFKKPDELATPEFLVGKRGTQIVLPVDSAEVFNLAHRDSSDGPSKNVGVGIRFRCPDGNLYYLTIQSRSGEVTPLESLKNTPTIPQIGINDPILPAETGSRGELMSIGTPIMETPVDNTRIKIISQRYPQNPHK